MLTTTVPFPSNFLSFDNKLNQIHSISKRQGNTDQKSKKSGTEMPKPNNNGVVITVYVESPSTNIRHPPSEYNPRKKIKRNPDSKKAKRSQGYDRRAELLAYTQELRAADHHNNEELEWNNENSKSKYRSKKKPKWKCPTTPRKLGISFLGIILRKTKGRRKYQRVPSETDEHYKSSNNGKKRKHRRRKFWRKLELMLRGLSIIWQRKKG